LKKKGINDEDTNNKVGSSSGKVRKKRKKHKSDYGSGPNKNGWIIHLRKEIDSVS